MKKSQTPGNHTSVEAYYKAKPLLNNLKAESIITQNSTERIRMTWDGERYALIHNVEALTRTIILNPVEAGQVVVFINTFMPTVK